MVCFVDFGVWMPKIRADWIVLYIRNHCISRLKTACKQIALVITALLLNAISILAGHNIGGEIIYDYLGNNQYRITLIVFKNCEPGTTGFDDPAALGIFETLSGGMVSSENLSLDNNFVEQLPAVLVNPCNIVPPTLCIEKGVYTTIVTLPPIAGGYTISYQRCCRADGIENLAFNQQGMTLVATIPDLSAINEFNSSARFTDLPPVTLCRNSEFFFNHGATDPDGDGLTYEFCSPFGGASADFPAPNPPDGPPYNSIAWSGGFNADNPITSNPGFSIDPNTGYLTGTPTQLGNFVVGVCVSEFRDGVLINTVRRDFQYRVIECESAEPSFPTLENSSYETCTGLTVSFDNLSPASNNTLFHWDFGVAGTLADTSNLFEPTFTFPGPGAYEIVLTTNTGWPCEDSETHFYTVYPEVVPVITENTTDTYDCINLQDTYDFFVTGEFGSSATILWNFGPGADPVTNTGSSPSNVVLPASVDEWIITVQVEENGCIGSDTQTIVNQPDPIAVLEPQNVFCQGLEYTFSSNSVNAATIVWDFDGNGVEDLSNPSEPTFLYSTSGTYDVQLIVTSPQACNDTAVSTFEIAALPETYFERPSSQCLDNNEFSFQAQGAQTLNPIYQWVFGPSASISTSNLQSPTGITFDAADVHPITLTITENGCAISYVDSIAVAQPILPEFGVTATSGCPGHVATVTALTESVVPVYYIWDFGNGVTSSQGVTNHAYELPGTYSITATAFTNEGCYDSLTLTFPNAVTIYPNPDPSFTIEPQVMDISEAVCQLESVYQDGDCTFIMSDGGTVDGCSLEYSWMASGLQTITHYVTSPQGCTSSATGQVIINGFAFYAPTGFSPNDDGLNDVWIPVMTGMSSFELDVYNKWGDKVFTTTDANRPWLGQAYDGTYYVPNDVYQYRVVMRDLLLQRHEFSGSFILIR